MNRNEHFRFQKMTQALYIDQHPFSRAFQRNGENLSLCKNYTPEGKLSIEEDRQGKEQNELELR